MMKRIITLLIATVLLLGLLAGCQSSGDLSLSANKDREIRQAYLDFYPDKKYTVDDLTLRVVWQEDGMYALYVDGPFMYADAVREVVLGEYGNMFMFRFQDGQKLYIYKNKAFYTLEEAYNEGILKTEHLESLQKDDVYKNVRFPNAEP